MGINIDGGMIIGSLGGDLSVPEGFEGDLCEWLEEDGIEYFSLHYDAGYEDSIYGFILDNEVGVEFLDDWLAGVKRKAAEFEKITGVKAKLFGSQSVW